ncbi:MAG: response regulator [Elusimicrobia bacterium]|nr:response regulator [Elusimicrobiota bacterium]
MSQANSPRVLVIDDDKNQRYMLQFSLQSNGYEVVAVASGQEALDQAGASKFDAAVCDIMMPGMNGVETLEKLKALQPELKVVMATGYATPQTALKSMKLGALNYITKPYKIEDLLDILVKSLRKDAGP